MYNVVNKATILDNDVAKIGEIFLNIRRITRRAHIINYTKTLSYYRRILILPIRQTRAHNSKI